MATIKSFTSLEQSKKLAKILPLESADMYYEWPNEKIQLKDDKYNGIGISCWSLAALLGVLPNGIIMSKDSQNSKYHFSSKHIGTYVFTDDPIDACYDMILKLHELNLL